MGAILSALERLRDSQGYYCDMVDGYLCRIGGWPQMIRFPKQLQKLRTRCPFCHHSSGLNLQEMRRRLKLERQRFKDHINEIVTARVADGIRQPYPCYKGVENEDSTLKGRGDSFSFLRYIKNSTIVPEEDSESEKTDDPFYFPVHIKSLIVCECMDCKVVDMEPPEKDEQLEKEAVSLNKSKDENVNT